MNIRAPLAAGAAVNLAAVSGLACLDPGTVPFPHLSARHPLASYMALAAAPTGNAWELFTVGAFIFAACFLVAGWRRTRMLRSREEALASVIRYETERDRRQARRERRTR